MSARASVLLLGLLASSVVLAEENDKPINPFEKTEARGKTVVEVPPAVEAPTIVLSGGTVMTAAGAIHSPGYVVLRGGKIEAVGAGAAPTVAGATVLDVTGQTITPGLIDTHSHIGVYAAPGTRANDDGNEATAPTTAGVWAEHSFWPEDPMLELGVQGGVTTMEVLPGSANLIGGRGVVLHMTPYRGSRAMRFPGAPETVKMACGENPKRVYGERERDPSTRMGNLRGQRTAFLEAREYLEKWQSWAATHPDDEPSDIPKKKKKGEGWKKDQPPERDLDKETLALILLGEALAEVHCYTASDMLSMLQVADEFGFEVRSFHHALEAYKIRDILAQRQVAVSTWSDWWGFKLEAYDGIQENLALVAEAGARAVVHSDSPVYMQRLNQDAGRAYYAGLRAGIALSEDQALRWITANPAWALGIHDQVGTLEVGKRADVVVWDGHPFRVYTHPRWVFVDGVLLYDRDQPGPPWSDFQLGQEIAP